MLQNRKKNIFLRLIVSIMVTVVVMIIPNYKFAEGSLIKLGDINGDGSINLTDLVVMLRHIAAEKSNENEEWLLTGERLKAGDIIKNNKIDSSDVLALLRYMAAQKSPKVAEKHKEWLELEKTEENKGEEGEIKEEVKEDNVGPKVEKIEAISKAGDYKTGSEIQIKVTFDEKIYAAKNKVALSSSTMPILNISFGEGEIKHPYVEENSNIETYIIYKYQITSEDKGTLKVNGAKAFDGTKIICDEARNEVTLVAGKDLTGNVITANEVSVNNDITKIVLDKEAITLDLSATKTEKIIATVTPSETALTWASSNSNVATIDGKTGTVTALAIGETDITVKAEDGTTVTCKVTVKNSVVEATEISLNKTSLKLEENNGERLTATVQPSNTTNQTVTWSSSNSNVATVSNSGYVTAKKAGTATITVKTANGKTATCQVTVKNSVIEATGISLNKTSLTKDENNGERLTATIQPSNATNQTVTWSSSNSSVATVSNSGYVTAKKEGTAKIIAKTANGKTATCQVTVKKLIIEVTSVKLNKTNLAIKQGQTEQLTATISPFEATNKSVTWSSSNTKVAKVDSKGKVTAVAGGVATITARTSNGKTATCSIKVTAISNEKINKTLNSSDFKKVVSVTPKDSSCQSAQSFCITEKYYVCALVNSSNSKTMLQVYNKSSGKLVNALSGNFYHANGMTYNSKNQKIYIAHSSGAKYSILPANNIATTKKISKTTKNLSKNLSGIAYDEYTGNYYVAKGSRIHVYNKELKYVKTIKKSIYHTAQDIGAYKGLILVIDYNKGENAIDIYRASTGKYLGRYKVNLSGELESISYDETNKNFALYINKGKDNAIYTTNRINLEKYYV